MQRTLRGFANLLRAGRIRHTKTQINAGTRLDLFEGSFRIHEWRRRSARELFDPSFNLISKRQNLRAQSASNSALLCHDLAAAALDLALRYTPIDHGKRADNDSSPQPKVRG